MGEPTIEFRGSEKFTAIKASCGLCSHVVFTGLPAHLPMPTAAEVLAEHLAQHEPGRALDIEVDWEPSAHCSVCEDGIGRIEQEDDGLICRECGATWDMDGRGGEVPNADD